MSVPDSYSVPVRAVSSDLPTPTRALAVGAHPDDVEFGCGATMAKWAAAGCEIFHLVCTDGSKGTWNASTDPALLVETRQQEQREAARRLGGSGEVVFLGWVDGELEAGLRQRWDVAYWIRKLRPDVILGHDPWRRYRIHPDHRNAGFLTTDSIVAARDPKFFPEQEVEPHRPTALLLWEADEPDHVERVEPAHLDTKLSALLAHESQYESTMRFQTPDDDARARFRQRITDRAAEMGALGQAPLAEAFKLIRHL